MIRFAPDSWVDALLRPFDMVAPASNTYVEMVAPDLRFAAAVLLFVLLLSLWRRRKERSGITLPLLAVACLSMLPWLGTTGNGRYFLAWLVLSGPICIGLVRLLPVTAPMKLLLVASLVGGQLFLAVENPPWRAWDWARWEEPPYFQLDAPPAVPATYVTVTSISYSLIAPQFPPQSRWINVSTRHVKPRAMELERGVLSQPGPMFLLAPALAGETTADGQPSPNAAKAFADLLAPHALFLREGERCATLGSNGLAWVGAASAVRAHERHRKGMFWLCPLAYRPGAEPPQAPQDHEADPVFEAVERQCPRFFPHEAATVRIGDGALRDYESADTKIYVLDDGTVMYKFWRSLNPVVIGTREQVLRGEAKVDCGAIRAPNWRQGGP